MLGHQFSHDFILAAEPGFELLDFLLLGGGAESRGIAALEGGRAIFTEGFLSEIKEGGLNLVLLANRRNGFLFQKMLPQYFDLVLGREITSFLAHNWNASLWLYTLAKLPLFPIPTEATHFWEPPNQTTTTFEGLTSRT